MPSHSVHRVPRTRQARTTHDKPRHTNGCQGQPGPHARTPQPQPVNSRPRRHAPKHGWSGLGELPTPDTPHTGKRRPPRAPSCRPHSAQSQLARVRAVGLGTGPYTRSPRTHSQWVVGPGRTPDRTGGRGWESARPRTPHTQARGAPPGRPRAALTARKASSQERVLWGGDRSPHPHPPHPHQVGSGPRPHTPKDGRSGLGGRPTPGAPRQAGGAHPGRPRAAPTARKASSQECALWGGDGSPRPHPPQPQPVGSWPRPHAARDVRSRMQKRPTPDAPRPGKRRPHGRPRAAPTVRKASSQECALWIGDGSPRPQPPHPQPVGSGPRPRTRKDGRSGVGERPTPDAPHPGKRRPPRAPSCHPHSAQSQLARTRAVGW